MRIRNGGLLLVLVALAGERPAFLDRAHPNRQHPRPVRIGEAAGPLVGREGGGGGQGGDGTSPPPITAPPMAGPPVRVQVPSADVRVTPPALLGRDLPEVRARTPAATVDTPAAAVPRLRIG